MLAQRNLFASAGDGGAPPCPAGCATTEMAPVKITSSGFLGTDYALLTLGETAKGQAGLRYYNPAARGRQYSTIIIEPVTFWGDEASKVARRTSRC